MHTLEEPVAPVRVRKHFRPKPAFDAAAFSAACTDADGSSGHINVGNLACSLGVSEAALAMLEAGWSKQHRAWTFPMKNGDEEIIGIRLRKPDGGKLAVTGSRAGLFIPLAFDPRSTVVVCEGPTDTAAVLDMGMDAVGRPSCNGGTDHLLRLFKRYTRDVVVVSDRDGPGYRGASHLATALRAVARSVKVIEPPQGFKDMRAWRRKGATVAMLKSLIKNTEYWRQA